jgi:hypothetical protein
MLMDDWRSSSRFESCTAAAIARSTGWEIAPPTRRMTGEQFLGRTTATSPTEGYCERDTNQNEKVGLVQIHR